MRKRNPLDILPPKSSRQGAKRKPPPQPKNQNPPKPTPPKRYKRFQCEFCHRKGHLVEFYFRRKRAERRELEWRNEDKY